MRLAPSRGMDQRMEMMRLKLMMVTTTTTTAATTLTPRRPPKQQVPKSTRKSKAPAPLTILASRVIRPLCRMLRDYPPREVARLLLEETPLNASANPASHDAAGGG